MLDLDWGKLPERDKIPELDVIIASDIIFWESTFIILYKTLKFLAS